MREDGMRADAALAARGLAPSRERARALIEAGLVTVNGRTIAKPAQRVGEADALEVTGRLHPYVGRGGLKLEKALKVFDVNPEGLICADIGASTGGFTDVLLQGGARRVYAVDVGVGQLDPSLAADPRVVSMERTNARTLTAESFPERPTLAVMDVSFISIRLILPALFALLGESGRVVTLVKPQFEAGPSRVGKNGIVSKPEVHADVLRQLRDYVPALGWRVRGLDYSPIAGGSGNLEFLADIVPGAADGEVIADAEIRALVACAHRAKPEMVRGEKGLKGFSE